MFKRILEWAHVLVHCLPLLLRLALAVIYVEVTLSHYAALLLKGGLRWHVDLMVRVWDVRIVSPSSLLRHQGWLERALCKLFILLFLQEFLSSLLLFHVLLVKDFVAFCSCKILTCYF